MSNSYCSATVGKLSGVTWVLAGQALQSLTNFLTITAVGRWAGADELGIFALGISCYFFTISVADTLICTPYMYLHVHAKPSCRDGLVVSGAAGAVLIGGLMAVPLAVLWWLDWTALARLWPALPCLAVLTVLREFLRRHLLVTHQYQELFTTDAMLAMLQIAGLAGLVLWGQLSAFGATAAVAGAAGGSSLISVVRLWPSAEALKGGGQRLFVFLRDAVRYGRWLFVGGLCHVGSVQIYPWLAMAGGGGARQAGLYAGCLTIVNLANPLLLGLTNYFRPRFMHEMRGPASASTLYGYVAKRSVAFVLPAFLLACAVSMLARHLLVLFFGQPFREAETALAWMAWGAFAISVAAPVQLALLALHAPFTNFLYHGFNLAALVFAAWLLGGPLDVGRLGWLYGVINLLSALLLVALLWRQVNTQTASTDAFR